MQKALAFWQGMVLLLVLLMALGIYVFLGALLLRLRQDPAAASAGNSLPQGAVQMVEPESGSIVQRSDSVVVRAMLLEPGFYGADLLVDGQEAASEPNPDPQAASWLVQWGWTAGEEGAHSLAVQARDPQGRVVTSLPVTVTVVPATRLLFASDRQGAYALYSVETDGRNVVRLTEGPGDAHRPAPRWDGVLAYVADDGVIRLLDAPGGPESDLVAGTDPAWAPKPPVVEGSTTYLAYAAGVQGTSQVLLFAFNGEAPRPLTAEETYAGQPAWAPDGRQVAYAAERDRNWDLWAVGLHGGEPRRLTDDPAMDWAPAWSPDGSRLAFVSNRGGSHQIYVMHADGSQVEALTSFPQGAESPAWSPDGFWLAFVAYTGQGTGIRAREIYVMGADGRNQVRLTYNDYDDTEVTWARP